MFKPIYTKLDATLQPLPADHPNEGDTKHLLVRVEHPLLAKAFIISAYRVGESVKFVDAKKAAEEFQIHGHACRAMHVEEAFFVADRTRDQVGLDTNFFPDAESYESTWTGDVDSTSPRDFAWFVLLGVGYCYWLYQSNRNHVRPVLAGQP